MMKSSRSSTSSLLSHHQREDLRRTDPESSWRNETASQIFSTTNVFLITFIILEATLAILQKKVAQQMKNYPATLTILQPCCTTILFGIGALTVHIQISQRRKRQLAGFSRINSLDSKTLGGDSLIDLYNSAADFPKWKLAFLGLMFTIFNFCIFSGSRGEIVSLPIIIILKQAAIPFTMIIAFIALRKRYYVFHFLGVFAIVGGIILSIWPTVSGPEKQTTTWWAMGLIVLGMLFISLATVFMEHSLKGHENLEMFWMWFYINLFEIVFAVPIAVFMSLIQNINIQKTPENVYDGFKCILVGRVSQSGDTCSEVGFWWIGFITVLILDKINQAYLLRHATSTVMWIASTCAVPLSALAFAIPFLELEHPGGFWELGGLGLVVLGLVLYRATKEGVRETLHYSSLE